ncbi:MAG: hypothetical protein ACR2MY_04260 [Candidatus Dormibacteria bacterium]
MTKVKILSAGVDSLYLSAPGKLRGDLNDELAAKRLEAISTGEPVAMMLASGASFVLKEHGWRGYPYWLSSPWVDVMIGAREPFPPVYVQLSSAYLHQVGAEAAVEGVRLILAADVLVDVEHLNVSRVDLYADEQGWAPLPADFRRFVCRALRRHLYEVPRQMHDSGRRLSGFTFGRGDLMARIYDKTLELSSRGQSWPELVWAGRDPEAPVWRIEFQFRRKALGEFSVKTDADLLGSRQDLWDYGMKWLSLRRSGRHHDPSRWPEAPAWQALRQAQMGSPRSGLIRGRIRQDNERRLVAGFVGYASSLAVAGPDRDLDASLRRTEALARSYLSQRGQSFGELVERKGSRRVGLL